MRKILLLVFCLAAALIASAKQPVAWVDWSDANFAQAKKENRLVILDLQAVWCHWCHVMEEKTYSNDGVAAILAKSFIAVRVDQDARPDISNRYQDYGWPATIIFNSDGKELAKRSGYFPPDQMIALLNKVVKNPNDVVDVDEQEKPEPEKTDNTGQLSQTLQQDLALLIKANYDDKLGGWDRSHKFLDAGLIEYLLLIGPQAQAQQTLKAQEALIDPVWGGVYQYSTGRNWHEPHFEKIMRVQTENLRSYAKASTFFHDAHYLQVAKKIQIYIKNFLTSPDGAFYTSQDADLIQGKHAENYFHLNDSQRRKKGIPRVDKNIYARENGWAIQALLELYSATAEKSDLDQAVHAAQWIASHRALEYKGTKGGFSHGDHDVAGPYLNDTLAMGQAFLELYSATGDRQWLEKAVQAGRFIAAVFAEGGTGSTGYVTAISNSKILHATIDGSENLELGRFANLLFHVSGHQEFSNLAKNTMTVVSRPSIAKDVYVAPSLLLFQRELNHPPLHITVVGHKDDSLASTLVKAALNYPFFYKRIDWWDKREGPLPNADVTYPELNKAAAFVCADQSCGLPAFDAGSMLKQIERLKK